MKLPDEIRIMIITLSDRAAAGEYSDRSGPLIRERLALLMEAAGLRHSIDARLIPDDAEKLGLLMREASDTCNLVFTTGGTGIGPKDFTVDIVRPMLRFEIPGIMEMIRLKYGGDAPNALLSRGVAGISGKSLVFTLPGSVRAVGEYLDVILPLLLHAMEMQHGVDSHGGHNH